MRWMWLALIGACAIASPAFADCNVKRLTVAGVSTSYDPFDTVFTPVTISVDFEGAGDCSNALVQFALAPTTTTPGTGPQIVLTSTGSATLDGSIATAGGATMNVTSPSSAFTGSPPSFRLDSNGLVSGDIAFSFTMPTGQAVSPDTYVAALDLLAQTTDKNGKHDQGDTKLSLAVSVGPSVRLAAGSDDLEIDLHEITPHENGGPVTFSAYSNVNYDLKVSSDNGWRLMMGPSDTTDAIPYTPIVSGTTLSGPSGPGEVGVKRKVEFTAPGGSGVRSHTFSVQVGNFSGAPAGSYSDAVTIEIAARV